MPVPPSSQAGHESVPARYPSDSQTSSPKPTKAAYKRILYLLSTCGRPGPTSSAVQRGGNTASRSLQGTAGVRVWGRSE